MVEESGGRLVRIACETCPLDLVSWRMTSGSAGAGSLLASSCPLDVCGRGSHEEQPFSQTVCVRVRVCVCGGDIL